MKAHLRAFVLLIRSIFVNILYKNGDTFLISTKKVRATKIILIRVVILLYKILAF